MAVLPDAFLQRFVRDRGHYLGFLRVICRDDELAEELFQELSIVVIEKIYTFDASRDFGVWVRGIARNLFLKAIRDRQRKSAREGIHDPALLDSIELAYNSRDKAEEEASSERVVRLRACLEKLPENLRKLLRDRYEANNSSKQLSELHNRSISAIETALSRVRATLLQCVQRGADSAS